MGPRCGRGAFALFAGSALALLGLPVLATTAPAAVPGPETFGGGGGGSSAGPAGTVFAVGTTGDGRVVITPLETPPVVPLTPAVPVPAQPAFTG